MSDVPIEQAIEQVVAEEIRVRFTPDGRTHSAGAALYIGHSQQTLADWRSRSERTGTQIGPPWVKVGGRIFYYRKALDAFIAGGVTTAE